MGEFEYKIQDGPFQSSWESLQKYECPQWFRDAKFGIWAHWGPQAVPEAGDWYARQMYIEGHPQYEYHLKNYGHPSKFGYKDIVKLWKAERFDPDALVKLYKEAGAKYFVALAVHHDNFDCWDSTHHKWNSVNIGPGKDIVGMFREATLKHGLRFGVTEHLERAYSWFNTNKGSDKEGPYAGIPYDGNDPKFEDFYFEAHDDTSRAYPINPPEWWKQQWYMRIKDLVEKYQPDLLYTDGGIPFGEVGRAMLANYYNNNIKWNGGKLEAVYNIKDWRNNNAEKLNRGEYQNGVAVLDLERGVVDDILPKPWQTDTCLGNWYYNKFIDYKTAEMVVHMLVDIVSKNGNLLLNFPLRADGTLDDKALKELKNIGKWMSVNGEAIYGTRPWKSFGEGPTQSGGGMFKEEKIHYTASDFRFTQKENSVYAILMAWPESGEICIKSLGYGTQTGRAKSVELLGYNGQLKWEQKADGLSVWLPDEKPCDIAWAIKVSY